MFQTTFLTLSEDFLSELSLSPEQRVFVDSKIGSFYAAHAKLVDEFLKNDYEIEDICFRVNNDPGNLWNGIPRVDWYVPVNDDSIDLSRCVLVIRFSLPNLPGTEDMSDTRYVLVEFPG